MKYQNYRFDLAEIDKQIAENTANLKKHLSLSDLKGYALGVINRRLQKDPLRYRDYGMYWGALKEVLRRHGYEYGAPFLPFISDVYKGETDLQTIIMADAFRRMYLDNFAIGTNSFVLDPDNPEFITFVDDEMENLAV